MFVLGNIFENKCFEIGFKTSHLSLFFPPTAQKMAAQICWIAGSLIYLLLGSIHLYYTFFTDKFLAKNPNTVAEMQNTPPLLTHKTTMWKAWVGFNASHSLGAIYLGMVNILLAGQYFHILEKSISILALTFFTSAFYLFLGRKYWFNVPLTGILVATCCYGAAIVLIF